MPTSSSSRRGDGNAMRRILVIDHEPRSSALVAYHLAKAGYGVITAVSGREGIDTARMERPELAVLNAVLPDMAGYDVLAELRRREETREMGVLVLIAHRQKGGSIKGLVMGADDCLAQPFAPRELVLRVGAILRRLTAPALTTRGRLIAGPVMLDEMSHRVQVNGADVALTSTEFKLLRALIERDGRVQTRAQLLETVWRAPPDVQTRTMDMHMQRLRHKLGPAGAC
ncbi:MAG TPA: response regulator transcription factor, partial [Gemmatimonadales bacterium]|nr:response regulator transcription factor [Gemmatimonadales bacterium]